MTRYWKKEVDWTGRIVGWSFAVLLGAIAFFLFVYACTQSSWGTK